LVLIHMNLLVPKLSKLNQTKVRNDESLVTHSQPLLLQTFHTFTRLNTTPVSQSLRIMKPS